MSEPIHIISLGAGVQSSTMALMAACGEITPMPVAAIFADTQAEPKSVYTWLDWLEKQLPFPVHRVTAGSLVEHSLKIRHSKKTPGNIYIRGAIPAFVENPDGTKGLLGRKCTADFKIRPLVKFTRSLCDWKRGEKRLLVIKWIGISYDEIWRMKESREKWIRHRHPLIDSRASRVDCLSWMSKHGFPEPPRSACSFCPFHSDQEWERLKRNEPEAFLDAVDYENRLQLAASKQNVLKGKPWLHSSMRAIGLVDFTAKLPSHQQLNMFNNECEGMCGV
jgi:glutaredoxin